MKSTSSIQIAPKGKILDAAVAIEDRVADTGCGRAISGKTLPSPSGIVFRIASSYFLSILAVMSDAMNPGAMALQTMFRDEYSLAIVFVSPMTPACTKNAHVRQDVLDEIYYFQPSSKSGSVQLLSQR